MIVTLPLTLLFKVPMTLFQSEIILLLALDTLLAILLTYEPILDWALEKALTKSCDLLIISSSLLFDWVDISVIAVTEAFFISSIDLVISVVDVLRFFSTSGAIFPDSSIILLATLLIPLEASIAIPAVALLIALWALAILVDTAPAPSLVLTSIWLLTVSIAELIELAISSVFNLPLFFICSKLVLSIGIISSTLIPALIPSNIYLVVSFMLVNANNWLLFIVVKLLAKAVEASWYFPSIINGTCCIAKSNDWFIIVNSVSWRFLKCCIPLVVDKAIFDIPSSTVNSCLASYLSQACCMVSPPAPSSIAATKSNNNIIPFITEPKFNCKTPEINSHTPPTTVPNPSNFSWSLSIKPSFSPIAPARATKAPIST